MTNLYTQKEKQINYGGATTGIIADVRDIIEIDPGDNTKIKVKAPYTIRTVDPTTPSSLKTTELDVPITAGISHTIPLGFTYWIGVKNNAGTPEYAFHFTLAEFDLTEFAILGRAFTDESVADQLNGVVGTFWWEGWNYGKTLYDFATSRELSFDLSNGGITPDAGLLTYTREEGQYWRFMSYNDLKNPNKGTDPQTAITAYFTYSSAGGFEQTSTFEVGFFDDSGVKTAVPANKWSIYKVFHFASSNFESAQRGKQTYDSLHDAKSRKGEEDLALNSDLENAAFTHIAFVKSGATDLTNVEEVVFEKINPNSLSSGGDPLISSLQGSGLIDWVGNDILTINGGDNTTFDTGEFRVGFVDRTSGEVKFIRTVAATTNITVTNRTTDPFTYIGYNISTDSFVQQSGHMARSTLDNLIPIGRLWHRNNSNLDLAQTMPLVFETSHDYAGQLLAFGGLKQSGLTLATNGANTKVNLATGVLETLGGTSTSRENISNVQPGAITSLAFTPVRRAATTAKVIFETATSDIDFDVFDDGSGTLATLSPNNFGIHYFYIFPFRTTADIFLVRGTTSYSNLVDAQTGLQQDEPPIPSDFGSGFLISAVVAKEGTTDLFAAINADNAVIAAADRFGNFGAGGAGGGAVDPTAVSLAKFRVFSNTGQIVPQTTVTVLNFQVEEHDIGGNFASDTFTAPVDGIYFFNAASRIEVVTHLTAEAIIAIHVNGTQIARGAFFLSGDDAGNNDFNYGSVADTVQLTAGDTVDVRVNHGQVGGTTFLGTSRSLTYFGGFQLADTASITQVDGWTDDGGIVRLTTSADRVVIGGTVANNPNAQLSIVSATAPQVFLEDVGEGVGGIVQDGADLLLASENGGINLKTGVTGLGDWTATGTTRMTVDNTGKMELIGDALTGTNAALTLNGGFSDGVYLDVGDERMIGVFNGGNLFMGYNFDYDTNINSYVRAVAALACGVEFTTTGDIDFRTAPTGSIGSSFTPTTRMRVASNGNINLQAYPNTRDDGTPINILGTDATGNLISGPNEVIHIGANLVDTTDQAIASAGTPQVVTFNTNVLLDDLSHTVGGSIITINTGGVYNMIIAPQLGQGSGAAVVEFWLKKNNVDLPNSNVQVSIAANSEALPLLRWKERFVPTDIIEVVWASNSTNTLLDNITSSYGGPNIPSIMFGMTHVGS